MLRFGVRFGDLHETLILTEVFSDQKSKLFQKLLQILTKTVYFSHFGAFLESPIIFAKKYVHLQHGPQ